MHRRGVHHRGEMQVYHGQMCPFGVPSSVKVRSRVGRGHRSDRNFFLELGVARQDPLSAGDNRGAYFHGSGGNPSSVGSVVPDSASQPESAYGQDQREVPPKYEGV